jgi:hypothetical protein
MKSLNQLPLLLHQGVTRAMHAAAATLVQLRDSCSSACRKRRASVADFTAGDTSTTTHIYEASAVIILSILEEAISTDSGLSHCVPTLLLTVLQVAEFEEESVKSRFAAGWQVRRHSWLCVPYFGALALTQSSSTANYL